MAEKGFMNLPLALGMGILGGLRPSRAPQSFFSAIGPGLAKGLQMYAANQPKPQSELEKLRLAQIQAQMARSAKLAENNKALLESLPPEERAIAQAMGPGEWAKTLMTNRNKTPGTVGVYNSRSGRPEFVSKSVIGTPGNEHLLPMAAKPKGKSDVQLLAESLNTPRLGKMEPGYSYKAVKDKNGNVVSWQAELIPGSAAAKKIEQDELKRTRQGISFGSLVQRAENRFGLMKQRVEKAREIAKTSATGTGVASLLLKGIPHTGAYNMNTQIKALQAMSGLDELNQLRIIAQAYGSTGASGLGQVTNTEHELLQQQWARLDPAAENFEEELDNFIRMAENSLATVKQTFAAEAEAGVYGKNFDEKFGAFQSSLPNPLGTDSDAAPQSVNLNAVTVGDFKNLSEDKQEKILQTLDPKRREALQRVLQQR